MDINRLIEYQIQQKAKEMALDDMNKKYSNLGKIRYIDVIINKVGILEDSKIISICTIEAEYDELFKKYVMQLESKLTNYILKELENII
jgi:predicted secreted protein